MLFVEMRTMALPTLLHGIAQVLYLYNKVRNAKVKMCSTLLYLLYYTDGKVGQWENRTNQE
jgi:hypothetical protein